MGLLYKYREFGEFTDKIILNSELYFASHNSFNDPFDCNLEFREIEDYLDVDFTNHCKSLGKTKEAILSGATEDEYKKWLKEELIIKKAEVGILSMSETKENILMWSHYSDYHKGLCFGFDKSFFDGLKINISNVTYLEDDKYELISFLNSSPDEIERMFTTKSRFWEYEKEIRLLDLNVKKAIGAKKFNKECLKEIIFGCKADEINIKKIIQLCQLNGFKYVVFKKARIVSGRFELDFEDIDKNMYL
jgi:hypothetical protein